MPALAGSAALRQTAYYGLGLVLMKSVSLFMLPFIAHRLSPQDYGRLEVLLGLLAVGTVLVGLGLAESLFRFVGDADDDRRRGRLAAEILGFALGACLLSVLLGQIAAPWIASSLPGGASIAEVRLALAMLALEGAIGIPLAWLRLRERAGQFFVLTSGKALIQAALVVLALESGLSVLGVLLAGAVAAAVQAILLVALQLRSTGVRWNTDNLFRCMRYGWPIVVSGLAAFATAGLDRWFLAEATGTATMAQYAVAAKFALVVALLLQPYGMWWFPRRFRVLREKGGKVRAARAAAVGAALGAVVAVGIAFTAPLALELLFPSAYHPAAALVPWLAAAMALKNAAELLNIGCYTGDTTHTQLLVNLTGATVAVAGFVLFIPTWGPEGVAGVLVLAQAVRLVLFVWLSQRVLPLPYPSTRLVLLGAFALLGLIASSAAQGVAAAWLIASIGWSLMGIAAWRLHLLPLPGSSAEA